MKRLDIYRYSKSNSKTIFDRFDARLRGKVIERVEIKYKENGDLDRVDIFAYNILTK